MIKVTICDECEHELLLERDGIRYHLNGSTRCSP